jgi:hypothetical protein
MAVLEDLKALDGRQRDFAVRLSQVESRLGRVEREVADLRQEVRGGFRSVDEHLAELKDLIIARDGG